MKDNPKPRCRNLPHLSTFRVLRQLFRSWPMQVKADLTVHLVSGHACIWPMSRCLTLATPQTLQDGLGSQSVFATLHHKLQASIDALLRLFLQHNQTDSISDPRVLTRASRAYSGLGGTLTDFLDTGGIWKSAEAKTPQGFLKPPSQPAHSPTAAVRC